MYTTIIILTIIICILLILIVLVQNPKGGGLASNFAPTNQVMGVKRTSDFLEKSTWGLAIALLVLSVLLSLMINRGDSGTTQEESAIQEQIDNSTVPTNSPSAVPTATDTTKK